MILLASVLIPIMLIIVFVFFATSPKDVKKKDKTNFNLLVLALGIVGCVAITLYSYFTTGKSVDSAWWPIAAFFGSITVFTIIIVIGGFYRNLVHFKVNR